MPIDPLVLADVLLAVLAEHGLVAEGDNMSELDPHRDTHLLVNTGGHWVAFVRKDVNDSWRLHDDGRVYAVPDVCVAIYVKIYNATRSYTAYLCFICGLIWDSAVNIQSAHSQCTTITFTTLYKTVLL